MTFAELLDKHWIFFTIFASFTLFVWFVRGVRKLPPNA